MDIKSADRELIKPFSLRREAIGVAALLGTALACPLSVAQNASEQDVLSLNIEELSKVKVYSASRHEEPARYAPSSVTVISAEEIRPLILIVRACLDHRLRQRNNRGKTQTVIATLLPA